MHSGSFRRKAYLETVFAEKSDWNEVCCSWDWINSRRLAANKARLRRQKYASVRTIHLYITYRLFTKQKAEKKKMRLMHDYLFGNEYVWSSLFIKDGWWWKNKPAEKCTNTEISFVKMKSSRLPSSPNLMLSSISSAIWLGWILSSLMSDLKKKIVAISL